MSDTPSKRLFSALIRPKTRFVISMHPYLPIEKDEDGTGGGIRLRVFGERGEPFFLDVEWGHTTEIEIEVPRVQ